MQNSKWQRLLKVYSPVQKRTGSVITCFCLTAFYNHSDPLTAADTQNGQPQRFILAAQRVDQRHQDTCSTGANWVAQYNSAAVDVDFFRVQSQIALHY